MHLAKYMGKGQQPDEELLPADAPSAASEPQFDQTALEQLMAMGFPENRCKRALLNTGNNGAEIAMNWLFEHMEDPGKNQCKLQQVTYPYSSNHQVSMILLNLLLVHSKEVYLKNKSVCCVKWALHPLKQRKP